MKTFKQFFTEQQEQYVILLPGGYKPPTKGHMYMIESYNNLPQVKKVLVLVGPKEREGVTREQSLRLFNLYNTEKLPKVTVESTEFDNPMVASFEFVEKDPRAEQYKGLIFAIGASDKGDDAKRAQRLVSYFNSKPEKLREGFRVGIPPIVKALETNGEAISATTLREAIRNKDIRTIQPLIPNGVSPEEFLKVFDK
jgi:hypothetical protein